MIVSTVTMQENRENASDDERTELSTNSDHNSNQHEEPANSPTSNAAFGPGAAAGLNLAITPQQILQMNMLQLLQPRGQLAGLGPLGLPLGQPLRPLPAFTTPLASSSAPASTSAPSPQFTSTDSNLYSPPLADPQMMHAYAYKYGTAGRLHNPGHRKNATRENTAPLKKWLNDHLRNPYPTKGEKIILAIISHMTLTQVSTWFANARRRLKKENKMTWERNPDDTEVNVDDDAPAPGPSRLSSPSSDSLRVNNNEESSPTKSEEPVEVPIPNAATQHQLLMSLQQSSLASYIAQTRASQEQALTQLLNNRLNRSAALPSSLPTSAGQIWKLADMANQTQNESD